MKIGNHNTEEKVLIIAEIGNNHEGNFAVAQDMVRRAADCGVDAVKFQTFQMEHFVNSNDAARVERMKQFELTTEQFAGLGELAKELGVMFISTPLDIPSTVFLKEHVEAFKIASGDITFIPMLEVIAETGKPVIMSTGASTVDEIQNSVQVIQKKWQEKSIESELAVLYCVSGYPVPGQEANLRSIVYLKRQFPSITIGYSDHTLGINASLISIPLGARIIEKHFTLDKNYSNFRDHQLSADPDEMKRLVEDIRQVEEMLGIEDKRIQPSEDQNRNAIRRSVVANKNLSVGHQITAEDLSWKRPGDGIQPGEEAKLIGKTVKEDVRKDCQILGHHFQ